MRKKTLIVLAIFSSILVIFTTSYVLFKDQFKEKLIPEIQKQVKLNTQLDFEFSDFSLSLKDLILLKPSLKIKEAKIENVFFAKSIRIQVSLKELLHKKIVIKKLIVDQANIELEENQKGEIQIKTSSNLQALSQTNNNSNNNQELQELELNDLQIKNSLAQIKLQNLTEKIIINDINFKVYNLKLNEKGQIACDINLKANLFESANSKINLNGRIGPISQDYKKIPVNLKHNSIISLNSLPEKLLKEIFAGFLQNKNTQIIIDSKMQGDLLSITKGQGQLSVDNLKLGKSAKEFVHSNINIPISLEFNNKITPTLLLETKDAKIKIESDEKDSGILMLNAQIGLNLKTGFIQGNSSGELTGLEVKNLLDAFSEFGNYISGQLFLTNYKLNFQATDFTKIANKTVATANLELKNGSIYILESITKYKEFAKQILNSLGSNIKTEKLKGKFTACKAKLSLQKRTLKSDEIMIKVDDQISINGSGELRKFKWLVYNINLDIPKLRTIPIKIRGELENPKIYPDIKKLTQNEQSPAINTLLQTGLKDLLKSK